MSRTLAELFSALSETTDKGSVHTYGPVYDRLCGPIRDRARLVLEIGVWRGGSIAAWREFFPHARVLAVDSDPTVPVVPGAELIVVDQADRAAIAAAVPLGPFDLVVDDGSHELYAQLVTWAVFLPRLSPNGLLVIEDLQTDAAIDLFRRLGAEIVDRRPVSGRYDDVLAVYRGVEPITGTAERVSVMVNYLAPATPANVRTRALFLPPR